VVSTTSAGVHSLGLIWFLQLPIWFFVWHKLRTGLRSKLPATVGHLLKLPSNVIRVSNFSIGLKHI